MTTRRGAGVVLITLGVCAVVLSFSAAPAGAQTPDQTGWWFELQTKSLPVPVAVPAVPDGGLFVQEGPSGPTAYGAVRARVPGAASATLILTAAQGSTTTLGVPLQACATTAAWTAPSPEPGNWEDAPPYSDHCTLGAVSSDGKVVAFFFETPFFPSGVLDVAIVPQPGSTPFMIAFDKPGADSLTTKVATGPAPSPTTRPAATAAGGIAPANGAANRAKVPTVLAPAVSPTPPPTTIAPAGNNRSTIAGNVLKVAGLGDPDRGERAAALGGASLIVVGWWLLSTRTLPMPRLIGGIGSGSASARAAGSVGTPPEKPAARIGGVGRFAKARDRNALTLR